MDAKARSQRDLGADMQQFGKSVTDPSPGETAAHADLGETLAGMDQAAATHLTSIADHHNATVAKQSLRRDIEGHVRHMLRVGRRVEAEVPGTHLNITAIPRTVAEIAFIDRARVLQATVTANKDLMVKHGLSELVFEEFAASLDRFERALGTGHASQQAQVAARAELNEKGRKIVRVGRVLDSLYRTRFRNDPEMLARWTSASAGLRTTRPRARDAAPATPAGGTQGSTTPPTPVSGSDAAKPAA
jgi:hypothetical protein